MQLGDGVGGGTHRAEGDAAVRTNEHGAVVAELTDPFPAQARVAEVASGVADAIGVAKWTRERVREAMRCPA